MFASQLSATLRSKGVEVRTAYLYPHGGDGSLPLGPGDVVLDGAEDHPCERVPGAHPRLVRRLLDVIDTFDPHVVQANGARTVKYSAAAHVRRPSFALIYRNIGDPNEWVSGRARRLLYRRFVLPQVDGVVGVSDATLANVQAFAACQVPARRIPRAVDVESLRPQRDREEVRAALRTGSRAPVLLYVGSLSQEKRPDRLARVFTAIRERVPEAHLWVAGDGPLAGSFAAELEHAGSIGSVRLLGVRADVGDLLGASDVLVLTSDTEGIPGVLLEAGAASVPVVTTAVGGAPECVIDGSTGFLVAPGDEAAMVDATCTLLADPSLCIAVGARARAHVGQHFALDSIADDYLGFYDSVRFRRTSPGRGPGSRRVPR